MEMESNNFKERIDDKLRHLFDGSELNVYENNFINLSAGLFLLLLSCLFSKYSL